MLSTCFKHITYKKYIQKNVIITPTAVLKEKMIKKMKTVGSYSEHVFIQTQYDTSVHQSFLGYFF